MFAVVHAHAFMLQAALRHDPGVASLPLALVDPAQPSPRVVALNALARARGVEEGLTAPQAMARCTGVVVRHRSLAAEESARDAMLQSAHAFSPHVEWTAPGCVTLDMRGLSDPGPAPEAGALRGWGVRLATAMRGLGLAVRVGIGSTPGVARHAAAAPCPGGGVSEVDDAVLVVEPGRAAAFLAGLPVGVLDPSPHAARVLHQWGVQSVGQLVALGQAGLAERLGLEAFALWAAASHAASRPLRHERLPETFAEEAPLDPPVEMLQPLLFLLRRFADSLSLRLAAAGHAAGELVLRLGLESGDLVEQRLRIPQPTGRADVLFRMLETHLEGMRAPAPVSGVRLLAVPTRPHQHQLGLFESALRDPHQFQETLARLAALVGPDRVGSPIRGNGHRPGQFQLAPPDFESAAAPVGSRIPEILRPVPVRRLRPAAAATVEDRVMASPRPLPASAHGLAALLDPWFRPPTAPSSPAPAQPTAPGTSTGPSPTPGRPASIRCAWVQGRIQVAIGPVHSSGEWWEAAREWRRVEWDVTVQGRHGLRLAWDGSGWSVDAVMD